MVRSVSVQNPFDSKVSVIKVETNNFDEVASRNPQAPSVTFDSDIDGVEEITITIASTLDQKVPSKGVRLSLLACVAKDIVLTKPVVESSKISSYQHRERNSCNSSFCSNTGIYASSQWLDSLCCFEHSSEYNNTFIIDNALKHLRN